MSSGTPTPNLGLHTFDALDDADYSEFNENMEDIDGLLTPEVVLSGGKPTTQLFPGRLAYETDNKRMMMYTGAAWVQVGFTPCFVRRRRNTTVAVNNGSTVNIDNLQDLEDSVNAADLPHAAGIITAQVAGQYAWSITGEWNAVAGANGTAVGRRRLFLRLNGAAHYDGFTDDMPGDNDSLNSAIRQSSGGIVKLAAGDTLQVSAFNSTGTNMVLAASVGLTIARIG